MSTSTHCSLATLVLVAGVGCVTTKTYDRKVAELDNFRAQSAERDQLNNHHIVVLGRDISALRAHLAVLQGTLETTTIARDRAWREFDDSTALVGDLQRRLGLLGQDVSKLTIEKGRLSAALELARGRLEALRRQTIAAETRAETFRHLVRKLHDMIDAGKLAVEVREGRMLIVMPTDVLFDSGRTVVKADAQTTLIQVADAIRDIKDRRFLVVGHTDDVPIHTARFPSNWELSASRAIAVASLLIELGLPPQVVGVAGHAEFDPVAANDNDRSRALNRRIEIVLEPNLSELPTIENSPAVSLGR